MKTTAILILCFLIAILTHIGGKVEKGSLESLIFQIGCLIPFCALLVLLSQP